MLLSFGISSEPALLTAVLLSLVLCFWVALVLLPGLLFRFVAARELATGLRHYLVTQYVEKQLVIGVGSFVLVGVVREVQDVADQQRGSRTESKVYGQ